MTVINFNGAFRTYLLADSTLSALISTRLYSPLASQKAALPYCTMQRISTVAINNNATFDSVLDERWQIDCYGETIDSVEAVKKAVFDRLHMKLYQTMSGYLVHSILFESENYIDEPDLNGMSSLYQRISLDFIVKRNYITTS